FLSAGVMGVGLICAKYWLGSIVECKIIRLFFLLMIAVAGYIAVSLVFNFKQTISILKWRRKK
ncbi:MAG: hypothetical protein J7J54_00840, partial [Candidatus Omnitrophica bacterium]|nr:hypothetical protein [Candidatus Omnitrophota bacterium]